MRSLSGIPYLPVGDQAGPAELVDAIRARRSGGRLLNLDRILLHSPPFAQGWNSLFGGIRDRLSLSPKLRELAIVAIGVINKADYEYRQHAPEFLKAGGTKEQLAALADLPASLDDTRLFDEAERATLALICEMTRDITVSDATMKRVRAMLPDRQVVELAGTIAGYNMVSRFVVAIGIEME
jgi:alkylhydroperoxidase family enzyme